MGTFINSNSVSQFPASMFSNDPLGKPQHTSRKDRREQTRHSHSNAENVNNRAEPDVKKNLNLSRQKADMGSLSETLKENYLKLSAASPDAAASFKALLGAGLQSQDLATIAQLAQQDLSGKILSINSQADLEKFLISKNFAWALSADEYTSMRRDLFNFFKKATATNGSNDALHTMKNSMDLGGDVLSKIKRNAEKMLGGVYETFNATKSDRPSTVALFSTLPKSNAHDRDVRSKRDVSSVNGDNDYVDANRVVSMGGNGGEGKGGSSGFHSDQDNQRDGDEDQPVMFKELAALPASQTGSLESAAYASNPFTTFGISNFGIAGGFGGCGIPLSACFARCGDMIEWFMSIVGQGVDCVNFFLAQVGQQLNCQTQYSKQMVVALSELNNISPKAKQDAANKAYDRKAAADAITAIIGGTPTYPYNLGNNTDTFIDHNGDAKPIWQFITTDPNQIVDPTAFDTGTDISKDQLQTIANKTQYASENVPVTYDLTNTTLTFDDGTTQNLWQWLLDNNIVSPANASSYQNGQAVPIGIVQDTIQQKGSSISSVTSMMLTKLQALQGQKETLTNLISSIIRADVKDIKSRIIQSM